MNGLTSLEGSSKGSLETIFEIEVSVPGDDMGKQVTIEGRVLGQKGTKVEHMLGRDKLVESQLLWFDLHPVFRSQRMTRVRAYVTHFLKNHIYEHSVGGEYGG